MTDIEVSPPGLAALLAARGPTVYVDARTGGRRDVPALADAAVAWSRVLDRAGILPGARVAVVLVDPLAFVTAHLSVMAAGRTSVPVDPGAPDAERARVLRQSGAAAVVTVRGDDRGEGLPTVLHADRAGRPERAAVAAAPARRAAPPAPGGTLLLTSGSTGEPKAVHLDERRLLHVAREVADHLELTPDDRGFSPLPLFHVNAQVVGVLSALVSGATLVLDRRFRRRDFWDLVRRHDVTWINAVPATLALLAREEPPAAPPPRLRLVRSASAPLPDAVRVATEERLGVRVVESYGMTEAASQIAAAPLHGPREPGSVGPGRGTEIAVRGADGADLPPGRRGRVWIRGSGVIDAYEAGRAAERFDAAGWLDSGDDGWLDGRGHLHLAGRSDDVINRGGELVYPREVEEVLLRDARVLEAVVVGRRDDVLGAVPVACVRASVTPDDRAGLIDDLDRMCREHLARWKRPVDVVLLDEIPTGRGGKVRRAAVRDLLEVR